MTEKKIERKLKPLFTWRAQICSDDGPEDPTTRHVLLTLACHMSELGDSCFPSIALLARETALANRTVKKHLKIAVESGWIFRRVRERHHGQGWRRYEYFATTGRRGASDAPPSDPAHNNQGLKNDAGHHVPHPQNVGQLTTEGGASDDQNVVHQVHLSTSLSTSRGRQGKSAQQCASEKTQSDPSTEQWLQKPESTLNEADKAVRTHYLQQMQRVVTQSDKSDEPERSKRSRDPKADPRAA